MNAQEYKALHESRMTDNSGTTPIECVMVVLPSIISLYHWASWTAVQDFKLLSGHNGTQWHWLFNEFFLLVCPCILAVTILADSIVFQILGMLNFCIMVYYYYKRLSEGNLSINDFKLQEKFTCKMIEKFQFDPMRRSYITNFRAITNMLTVLCILAVDFSIFPRRFAKTETFGYGVMDLGVGLFVIANALVAPEARTSFPVNVSIRKSIMECIPLLVLGMTRMIGLSKMDDYQQHFSEYGKDWNFFLTLAVTKLMCALILKLVKRNSIMIYFVLSGSVISMYQCVLYLGLQDWILSDAPRVGFVAANREGLASNLGYISLYFGGIALAKTLRRLDTLNPWKNKKFIKRLFALDCVLWAITFACENSVRVSRRLANMGYFFWILTFSSTVLTMLLIVEFFVLPLKYSYVISKSDTPPTNVGFVPKLYETINKCGLIFFLKANVVTLVINLCIQTFLVPWYFACIIIVFYMVINCVGVVWLHKLQWHKFTDVFCKHPSS